ncbi:hypothetical protein K435DRAFT_777696 [Dendrothele bispora CBS 962.96]|uniref:Uncharacterized protein n=1 Tax=Dendrothele bispora (strain CBS 962.96) TaxID=1314807 RepID=A0A4V4HGA0_DENBC|nr:hypothetical protein K435DRAFT_777696 [Dendrothele bispora CBS 962.96]
MRSSSKAFVVFTTLALTTLCISASPIDVQRSNDSDMEIKRQAQGGSGTSGSPLGSLEGLLGELGLAGLLSPGTGGQADEARRSILVNDMEIKRQAQKSGDLLGLLGLGNIPGLITGSTGLLSPGKGGNNEARRSTLTNGAIELEAEAKKLNNIDKRQGIVDVGTGLITALEGAIGGNGGGDD